MKSHAFPSERWAVSHRRLLFGDVLQRLKDNPSLSLVTLARSLGVGSRTVQHAVKTETGKSFRVVRDNVLVERVKALIVADPSVSVKFLSFSVGYKSSRSFARAIRRISGLSPQELRSITEEALLEKRHVTPTQKG